MARAGGARRAGTGCLGAYLTRPDARSPYVDAAVSLDSHRDAGTLD